MKFFIPIFGILLAGIGLKNVLEVSGQKKKYAVVAVIICLLLSVSFSGFYQHWRTNIEDKSSIHTWYMAETPYAGALWIKDNIDVDKKLIYDHRQTTRRMFAISEVPTFVWDTDVCLLTYGFADESDITIFKNSPLTEKFYMETPYVDISKTKVRWYGNSLEDWEVDSQAGKSTINQFDLSYAINNILRSETTFIQSLKEKKDCLYNNGRILVWNLD